MLESAKVRNRQGRYRAWAVLPDLHPIIRVDDLLARTITYNNAVIVCIPLHIPFGGWRRVGGLLQDQRRGIERGAGERLVGERLGPCKGRLGGKRRVHSGLGVKPAVHLGFQVVVAGDKCLSRCCV